MKTRPYSPSSHYVFLNTYTCQIPTGYVFLSTYTSRISRWEALQGPEWWFAGLYGRKPLAPPNADLATRALCRQNTQLFFNSYVFLSTYTSLIPGWGGTPGSGMVVSRPLRRGLPETPWPPKCRPCHLRLLQTTPYSPSNHYVLLTTHTSWLPRWRRPPRSGIVVCRPLRSSLPETPGTPQCRPRRQDNPTFFLPDSDGEALQGMEWCFPGLYGAACRKPLAPPTPATLRFPLD